MKLIIYFFDFHTCYKNCDLHPFINEKLALIRNGKTFFRLAWSTHQTDQNTKKQNKNGPKDCIEFNININAPSGEHSDKPGSGQGQDKKTLFAHLLLLNNERNSYPVW